MNSSRGQPLMFRVVRAGARPLLAIPAANAAVRGAAVACYPAHTGKKRLVRALLRAVVSAGVDRLLWPETVAPIDGIAPHDFGEWVGEVRTQLGAPQLQPVLVWPADAARGRIYAYWLDASGRVTAFSKLALDEKNSGLIHNEQRALETLAGLGLRASRVPRVLAAGRLRDRCYLAVETAPREARITQWENDAPIAENVREYAGAESRMPLAECMSQPWLERFIARRREQPKLVEAVCRAGAEGVEVCRVHGDLNQTNILRTEREIWLLDWERSTECGPCLTDLVCMEVDRLWPRTKRDAIAALRDFLAAHWTAQDEWRRRRVLLAMAYLTSADFTPATALLDAWAPQLSIDG